MSKKPSAVSRPASRAAGERIQASGRPPKPGLGRGLGALIGPRDGERPMMAPPPEPSPASAPTPEAAQLTPTPNGHAVLNVPTAEIRRSPWQPRQNFDEEALRELADSIRANGVIQPLICRRDAEGRYELIAGERRLRAAIEAHIPRVPVILIDAEDRRAAELAIIENIQRQDLNVIEEAEGYQTLAETFNLTQQEVADRVGKARASIANALRLLDLPDEVKRLLGNGQLSTGHAKVLLGLADPAEQAILGRKCVIEDITVRALEKLIRRRRAQGSEPASRTSGIPDLPESYVRDLTDRLHKRFCTAVRLMPGITHANGKHTKGVLEIDFYTNDDLDRLLTLLGITLD